MPPNTINYKSTAIDKIHALMDGAPIPCALNNELGDITFLNKSFIETLGYTLKDIPNLDHWWPLAYPDENYRAQVLSDWGKRMDHAISQGTDFQPMELQIMCKNGNFKTFLVGASEIESDFKNEHLVTLFDISERIELEKRHQEKDQNYKTLFESAAVSIWNEDLSELLIELDSLKKNKNTLNIKEYLENNLDYTHSLTDKIKVTDVNNATLRMFEVENKASFLNHIEKSFGEGALDTFINEIVSIYNGDDYFRSESNYISFKGNNLNAIISIPIPKSYESAKCVPVSIFDITELKQTESELHYHGRILDSVAEGVYFIGEKDGIIKFSNERFNKIFGYEQGELIGKHVSIVNAPSQDPQEKINEITSHLKKSGSWHGEVKNVRKNGEEFWSEASVSKFTHQKYGPIWISVHDDITKRKLNESIIWHQANYDSVCNLPNRNLFSNSINQEIKSAERNNSGFSILFIDLDNFKDINDTLGHNIGDKLLISVSQRIKGCIRQSDIISRFGGDEFTVLLSNTNNINDVQNLCENIQHEICKEFNIENETVFISASIGISSYPHDSKNSETLIKYADQAMYLAKESGRKCISYFTRDLQVQAEKNRKLNLDLRAALPAGEFEVYYQPILELHTNKIVKAEALIRWKHPINGFVSPELFIPLAEKNKLIIEIGNWVFNETVTAVKEIRKYYPSFQININKSPIQIEDEKSDIQTWINTLKQNNLPCNSICIEITEGLLLNMSNIVTNKLKVLTEEDIQFALDDFGTGYSSLAYLTKFDLDYIKIDRSFIKNIDQDPRELTLCRAIISMAHSLGKKVVAEGVETLSQKSLLESSNCDYAQGFYYHKPMPLKELIATLDKVNH